MGIPCIRVYVHINTAKHGESLFLVFPGSFQSNQMISGCLETVCLCVAQCGHAFR